MKMENEKPILFNGKSLTEFTDRELLKLLAEKVKEHRSLEVDEQDYLDKHDGREFWDEETEKEYQKIIDDILDIWFEIYKITEFVEGLK